jgi:hypothetical protein
MKKSIIALAVASVSLSLTAGFASAATIIQFNDHAGFVNAVIAPLPGTGHLELNLNTGANTALGVSNAANIDATTISDPFWTVQQGATESQRVVAEVRRVDINANEYSIGATGSANSLTYNDNALGSNDFNQFTTKTRGTVAVFRNGSVNLTKGFNISSTGALNIGDLTFTKATSTFMGQVGENRGPVAVRAINITGDAREFNASALALGQSISVVGKGGDLYINQASYEDFQGGNVEAIYVGSVNTTKNISVNAGLQTASLSVEDTGTLNLNSDVNLQTNVNGQDSLAWGDFAGTTGMKDGAIGAKGIQAALSAELKNGTVDRLVQLNHVGETVALADFGDSIVATGTIGVSSIGASAIDNYDISGTLSSFTYNGNITSVGDVLSDISGTSLTAKSLTNLAAGSINQVTIADL